MPMLPVRPSPIGLTVLLMLLGGPLHPYEMQRRMKAWGKDKVVNIGQRVGLYRTIDRLHAAGLLAVHEHQRGDRFPDRTVYRLTDEGLRVGREWLTQMLAEPRNEYPVFPAALSFVFGLLPEEAVAVLERRAAAVREQLAALEAELAGDGSRQVPRVTLLESEYLRATTAAELAWLDSVLNDLRAGSLSWSGEELARTSTSFLPD
jgi:DNA-binding PadR family transcriptional regulator